MSTAVSEAEDSVKQLLTGQAIQDSLPSKTILSTKSAAAGLSSVCEADRCSELSGKDNLEGRSQSVPPSSVTQPVRNPFALSHHRDGFQLFLPCFKCNLGKSCLPTRSKIPVSSDPHLSRELSGP